MGSEKERSSRRSSTIARIHNAKRDYALSLIKEKYEGLSKESFGMLKNGWSPEQIAVQIEA